MPSECWAGVCPAESYSAFKAPLRCPHAALPWRSYDKHSTWTHYLGPSQCVVDLFFAVAQCLAQSAPVHTGARVAPVLSMEVSRVGRCVPFLGLP